MYLLLMTKNRESTDENDKVVMARLQENIRDHNNKLTIDYNLSVSIGRPALILTILFQ
ncbi:MAG: hypothetical protein ACXU9L_07955 [Thermodesulfobacteriota bacterium]